MTANDQLLLYASAKGTVELLPQNAFDIKAQPESILINDTSRIVVIGGNDSLYILLRELPDSIEDVVIANVSEEMQNTVEGIYASSIRNLSIFHGDVTSIDILEGLVRNADHVVLLSDYEADTDDADLESTHLILKLRDIKNRLGLRYTITAEMRRENNRDLIAAGETTDFIVASNIVSMVLAQLAMNPLLKDVFDELLSDEGNELYLKPAAYFGCSGKEMTVHDLRLTALSRGYLLMGYLEISINERITVLNPMLHDTVTLSPNDNLIVLGTQ